MTELSRAPTPEHVFSELYRREYGDVLRFIQRRTTHGGAEDAAAEAFVVAWRRLADLPRGEDASRAWLFGIARHVLLNERRGVQRQQALGVRIADHESIRQPSTDGDAVGLMADLQRVWPRLSAVHQEALALTVFEDLDAPAAAQVLGISPVAYRLRLSRARRALRLHLHLHPESASRPITTPGRTASS